MELSSSYENYKNYVINVKEVTPESLWLNQKAQKLSTSDSSFSIPVLFDSSQKFSRKLAAHVAIESGNEMGERGDVANWKWNCTVSINFN